VRRYFLVCETKPRCGCLEPDDTGDDCACRVAVAGAHTCASCGAELVAFDRELGWAALVPEGQAE